MKTEQVGEKLERKGQLMIYDVKQNLDSDLPSNLDVFSQVVLMKKILSNFAIFFV